MKVMECSNLQKARYGYKPKQPEIFCAAGINGITVQLGNATGAISDQSDLKAIFKHSFGKPLATFVHGKNDCVGKARTVAVILSGGQAPGGHNVIAGIFDGLKQANPASHLLGFLNGPSGLINGEHIEITSDMMDKYRNTGGFDMIGSGRTKIETPEQFASSLMTAKKLNLNAIVIIGGDDSNTNAALLAEYFLEKGSDVQVIGCPKTIDGDLKNEYIETSFGFDTAVKTYSELIGNIERDANSAKKYWHFIKLMGRSASHITLEAALQTHPNICLISEEVEKNSLSLSEIIDQISHAVIKRADNGENFGVILIPEGLVEFIPEVKALISELNDLTAKNEDEFGELKSFDSQRNWLEKHLSRASMVLFENFPEEIAKQLLLDRDPHGNVQVSRIETEKLLIGMVERHLAVQKSKGVYKGKFSALGHFFGYEGRAAFPSNFDADYCYNLGYSAFALIACGLTGYLSSVRNLTAPASQWLAGGVPLTMMMNMEQRHGSKKPVIKKALVELDGAPFKAFAKERTDWACKTCFVYPGAIQYFGPSEVCDQVTATLRLEHAAK
ncbi:MAG: diphosphate--fructose-6-phosphate 1-phosphotransferase [Termitinemataceae bacterium]|nr:MAG: diphosphate--fructose-6-phosphate 1-phosphotransferase [Termitinemataceae bacterium]